MKNFKLFAIIGMMFFVPAIAEVDAATSMPGAVEGVITLEEMWIWQVHLLFKMEKILH